MTFAWRSYLAFDRTSVREYDRDGHLHVKTANISKATVNPYVGREIPNWEGLGLDPQKVYNLLRHPAELKKGASTFAGKPLLIIHQPLNSQDHPTHQVIGAVGTEVEFDGTYLKAPLTIWPQFAIDLIESGRQRELSCGYSYDPDMTPGEFEDESYDGIMRNIVGNHVALVEEGRAGPDVIIGDSAQEFGKMNMNAMKLNVGAMPGPQLKVEGQDEEGEASRAPTTAELKSWLLDRLGPDDYAKFERLLADLKRDRAKDEKGDDKVSLRAMDRALRAQRGMILRDQRELREAYDVVRPYVGEIAIACDSAEQVYRAAIEQRGIKEARAVHRTALRSLFLAVGRDGVPSPAVAMDTAGSAARDRFAELFPTAPSVRSERRGDRHTVTMETW